MSIYDNYNNIDGWRKILTDQWTTTDPTYQKYNKFEKLQKLIEESKIEESKSDSRRITKSTSKSFLHNFGGINSLENSVRTQKTLHFVNIEKYDSPYQLLKIQLYLKETLDNKNVWFSDETNCFVFSGKKRSEEFFEFLKTIKDMKRDLFLDEDDFDVSTAQSEDGITICGSIKLAKSLLFNRDGLTDLGKTCFSYIETICNGRVWFFNNKFYFEDKHDMTIFSTLLADKKESDINVDILDGNIGYQAIPIVRGYKLLK